MFDVYLRKAKENGKVIFPKEFCLTNDENVDGKRKSLEALLHSKDIWEYSGQYMNDPVDEGTVEFKRAWFQTFQMSDALVPKLQKAGSIMSVDPAFRLKQTNDFSGICVTKTTDDNMVYVLEARKVKVNPKGLIEEIFRLVGIYQPYKVLVETTAAQIILLSLLRDEMRARNKFFAIEEVKVSTQETKAMRIRGMIPHYANGRVWHAPGLKDLENELIEFPRGTHDDVIDALAQQVPHWRRDTSGSPVPQAPAYSFDWWRKQRPNNLTVLGRLFRDVSPGMR